MLIKASPNFRHLGPTTKREAKLADRPNANEQGNARAPARKTHQNDAGSFFAHVATNLNGQNLFTASKKLQ